MKTDTSNSSSSILMPTILYVDDEEHNLTVFEATFEDYYDVRTAESARQAFRILQNEPIHVLVTDQRMPEMTGVQLLEAVIDEYPEIVRLILTGYADMDAVVKAINSGRVYHYATKPWVERELKIVLDRAIANYRLRQRNRRLMAELSSKAAREEQIRKAFQQYVPATVVDELLDPRTKNRFQGESRIVAVLISDIRGFTSLANRLAPDQVVRFLNRYYSIMNAVVARNKGNINKYLGDGMIAVFGAPISSLNNAENAVRAAVEMVEELEAFNRDEAVEMVGEGVRIGIGVDMGEVVAGNVGSEEKMEYTVIGEPVAVAEEIEAQTKSVPGANPILISEGVYSWVDDLAEVEKLEPLRLPGQSQKSRLYRVRSLESS